MNGSRKVSPSFFEFEGPGKILEFEDMLYSFDSVHFLDLALRDLWLQYINFTLGQDRLVTATANAFH